MSTQHQLELFAAANVSDEPPALDRGKMEAEARRRLALLMAAVEAADSMPWPEHRVAVNATVFHNMANWLQADERDIMRARFAAELRRLNGGTPVEPL